MGIVIGRVEREVVGVGRVCIGSRYERIIASLVEMMALDAKKYSLYHYGIHKGLLWWSEVD